MKIVITKIMLEINDRDLFHKLLGDGSKFGINISYEIQLKPEGIAQAFLIGKKFIGESSVSLILKLELSSEFWIFI